MVPKEHLIRKVKDHKSDIERYVKEFPQDDGDILIEYLSARIHKAFDVSEDVMTRRIRKERILDDLGWIEGNN